MEPEPKRGMAILAVPACTGKMPRATAVAAALRRHMACTLHMCCTYSDQVLYLIFTLQVQLMGIVQDKESIVMPEQQINARIKDVSIPRQEQEEIDQLYATLRKMEAKLLGPDGKAEILPGNINAFLFGLLRDLQAGYSVTILQNKAQLTTVEASKLLGMSRQFLVRLLDKGEIPFHKVGTHRRLYARDVLSYKKQRDTNRRKALVDLARAENEEGLYSVPDDFNTGQ